MKRETPRSVQPIKRRKAYEEVVDAIQRYIVEHELEADDRLPSERELTQMLGVSSRTVREAVMNLQTKGVLRVAHGQGVYVANNQMNTFLDALTDSVRFVLSGDRALLFEVIMIRRMIDGELTARAAKIRSDDQLERLKGIVAAQKRAMDDDDVDTYNEMDVRFHEEIVNIAGYRIIEAIYKQLYGLIIKTFHETGYSPGSMQKSFPEHKRIVELIQRRDGDAARRLVEKHLERTLQYFRSEPDG